MLLMTATGVAALYIGVKRYLKGKNDQHFKKTLNSSSQITEKNNVNASVKERMTLILKQKRQYQRQRQQQLQAISGNIREISAEERQLNRGLAVASANLGIAVTSLFYAPLIWVMIPGLIYCYIPLYRLAYNAMKERRISFYILDVILVTGMFIGGFFATAGLGIWVFLFGRKLLLKSEHNTKKDLSNLFGEQPRFVWLMVNGSEIEIPFEKLKTGDVIVISAGQRIPVDGVITQGTASIDQHTLMGEAKPVEKVIGDSVLASTVVLAGRIYIETQKTGSETMAMQIGHILNQTADFKSVMQSRGEAIADQTVIPTLGMGVLVWPFFGFSSALAVLTNALGYKMRIFGPVSMLNFLSYASQQGILIKDGRSLELIHDIDTVVFDKTGTLTLEEPTMGKIHSCADISENDILKYAAAAEHGQTHPIAKTILAEAHKRHLKWSMFDDARYEIGYGIQVNLGDQVIQVGSDRFMELEGIEIPIEMNVVQASCHENGYSLIMVAINQRLVGAIELHATLRPEAKQIVQSLHQRNMSVYIISGDQEQPTKKLAQELGITHYFANTLPENKAEIIGKLQDEGRSVCFVGDGINDTIALKKASVSVSLSGATTMAMDTAQIVLMDGSLKKLNQLFDISKDFKVNMKNNFRISVVPTAICIGGIILFHWGVFIAHVLMGTTLFIGIGNTMLPLLKSQNTDNETAKLPYDKKHVDEI